MSKSKLYKVMIRVDVYSEYHDVMRRPLSKAVGRFTKCIPGCLPFLRGAILWGPVLGEGIQEILKGEEEDGDSNGANIG